MKTGRRNDPLPVFCFKVEWSLGGGGPSEAAFFKSVAGLRYETEIVSVREGGANDTTFNLIGATKWAPLVFKQGFTSSSALLAWREEWLSGRTRTRVTGTVIQLDTELQARARWRFFRGWPAKWELSELDASKSELAIETLEIAHDGLEYSIPSATAGAAQGPRGSLGAPPSGGRPAGPRGSGVGAPPSAARQAEAMQLFRDVNGPPAKPTDKPGAPNPASDLADELE